MTSAIQMKTTGAAYADPATTLPKDKSSTDALANKETFLQLLVAQIKNQDPMNPADGTQFLTQLAQFSELEQLISIRKSVGDMAAVPAGTGETAATGNSGSGTSGSGTDSTKKTDNEAAGASAG